MDIEYNQYFREWSIRVSCTRESRGMASCFTLVKVLDLPVMSQEECSLITVALEHRHLLQDHPITPSELLRIATDDKAEKVCKCVVYTGGNIEPTLLMVLKNIMACCSELGGRLLSGNLTKYYHPPLTSFTHTKAGLTDLQIQAEVKSDASVEVAGSKVVINFGCGEHRLQ